MNSNMVKCDNCGRKFAMIDQSPEAPQGVTFVLVDNTSISLCRYCLIDLGKGTFKPKSAKLKKIWREAGDDE